MLNAHGIQENIILSESENKSKKSVDSEIVHGQSTVVSDKNPPVHESLSCGQ